MEQVVKIDNLDGHSFIGIQKVDGSIKLKLNLSPQEDNALKLTEQGYLVAIPLPSEYKYYHATKVGDNVTVLHNSTLRRVLEWNKASEQGTLHIDFTFKKGGHIFNLPADAPVPNGLLEVQTFDGGTVFIDAKSRSVMCTRLTANTRYVVDLKGRFNLK